MSAELDSYKTLMIFRFWRGDVIALMPEDMGDLDERTCASYQHVGQHAIADFSYVFGNSRAATELEYRDLYQELTKHCGYDITVFKGRVSRTQIRSWETSRCIQLIQWEKSRI